LQRVKTVKTVLQDYPHRNTITEACGGSGAQEQAVELLRRSGELEQRHPQSGEDVHP